MSQPIELIAGLGNPDPEHLMTRHNAGFWFVDALAQSLGETFKANKKLQGLEADVRLDGHRLRLLKPMTYMNNSGRAVAAAMSYYKIPADRLLVVYDEIDLPPGRAKLRRGGGHAGHKGVRSIIEHAGADFWRMRIGVGHPGPGQRDAVVGHVLKRISNDDADAILETIRAGLETLPILLEHGGERAQTHLHSFKPAAESARDDSGDAGAS